MKAVDMGLRLRTRDESSIKEICRYLKAMGYSAVALSYVPEEMPRDAYEEVANVMRSCGLRVYRKLCIKHHDESEAKRMLSTFRGAGFHVVCAEPTSLQALRWAARDSRVMLIRVPHNLIKYIDDSQARLMSVGGGLIDVALNPLTRPGDRALALRSVISLLRRAISLGLMFVFSSEASSVVELWHPREILGLCELAGLRYDLCMPAITTWAQGVLGGGL